MTSFSNCEPASDSDPCSASLAGQPPYLSQESRIDLSVFVLDEGNTTSWTAQDYALQPSGIVMQAACLQNTSHPGSCGAFLDGLNTSAKYFLWAVTG